MQSNNIVEECANNDSNTLQSEMLTLKNQDQIYEQKIEILTNQCQDYSLKYKQLQAENELLIQRGKHMTKSVKKYIEKEKQNSMEIELLNQKNNQLRNLNDIYCKHNNELERRHKLLKIKLDNSRKLIALIRKENFNLNVQISSINDDIAHKNEIIHELLQKLSYMEDTYNSAQNSNHIAAPTIHIDDDSSGFNWSSYSLQNIEEQKTSSSNNLLLQLRRNSYASHSNSDIKLRRSSYLVGVNMTNLSPINVM